MYIYIYVWSSSSSSSSPSLSSPSSSSSYILIYIYAYHHYIPIFLSKKITSSDARSNLLVFDLGGGTFDVSVMEAGDGVCEVSQIHGGLMMKKRENNHKKS